MSASADTLRLLTSIDASLRRIADVLAPAPVNLDGPYGDPVVRHEKVRDWNGDSMKGRHFSECPPEFLDVLAPMLDYFASNTDVSTEDGAKKQKFDLMNASRARAWAKRLRDGWKPAQPQQTGAPEW